MNRSITESANQLPVMEGNLFKNEASPSDVMLIFPYFYTHASTAMLFHPLGIAQLTAQLRRIGIRTTVVDCTFEDRRNVIAQIRLSSPKIVGIYIMLSMTDTALTLANGIRRDMPGTLLVCGGPLPTLKPSQFENSFDVIFCGESVHSFPRFCRDYLDSNATPMTLDGWLRTPARYPGIYSRRKQDPGVIMSKPKPSDSKSLNLLPVPDRSDYAHAKYRRFWMEREGVSLATLMTSYGCPFDCEFCSKPIFGSRFRRRAMDHIFEEIRDVKTWGYNGLWIADDCFSLDPNHARAFCTRMISEKLDMKWFCLCRVDGIEQGDINLWQAAGCRKVFFGLESGCNDILKLMNKEATTEMAEQTIRLFEQSNIRTAGFFMVGYPGETHRTIEKTFQWALSLPLDEISFTIPYPLPGTRLYSKVAHVKTAPDWRYENENRLLYQSEFDEDYLRKRIEAVYDEFNNKHRSRKVTANRN